MKSFLPILYIPLILMACAYPNQMHKVLVKTEPNGARVYLGEKYVGESPVHVAVETNAAKPIVYNRYVVSAKKDGYIDGMEILKEKIFWNFQKELLIELDSDNDNKKIGDVTTPPAITPGNTESSIKKSVFQDSKGSTGNRFAVIIGISDYSDSRVPSLRYASKDAESFYHWIVSPSGGKFAPSRVNLLLNDQATYANIKNALFSWLKQAIKEDVVIIFFAGHGSSDSPDSNDNLFLLPYDTRYDDISASGFPMWDIETALKRFIKAEKVVVIADACHSGGVGGSFDIARRGNRMLAISPISEGLQNLSSVGHGVCVISASGDKQLSQENLKWGGGHGVFTHFLLKGLNGDADYNDDTRVTLGELIPFLSEKVRRETKNAQSPTVAGKFDPALTISKVAD